MLPALFLVLVHCSDNRIDSSHSNKKAAVAMGIFRSQRPISKPRLRPVPLSRPEKEFFLHGLIRHPAAGSRTGSPVLLIKRSARQFPSVGENLIIIPGVTQNDHDLSAARGNPSGQPAGFISLQPGDRCRPSPAGCHRPCRRCCRCCRRQPQRPPSPSTSRFQS